LLLPQLPTRIVNVASAGQAPIDFGDVMLERYYDGARAYRQSKLAQIMFTFDLAEELDARTANCLHPATYMPAKMVLGDGTQPVSSLREGAHAHYRPRARRRDGPLFQRHRPGRTATAGSRPKGPAPSQRPV
jgi:NAD(P)-dependent dehydrogenase (short-subunit alcohol dehydrogenase family)